jgi:hypothetical protein
MLIRKFDAQPVIAGLTYQHQPLMAAIRGSLIRESEPVLSILRHFFETRKDLLDPKWWKPANDGTCMNPVTACVHYNRPKALDALLLSGQEHLNAAVNSVEAIPRFEEDPFAMFGALFGIPTREPLMSAGFGQGPGRAIYASASQLAAAMMTSEGSSACLLSILQNCIGVRVASLPTPLKSMPKSTKSLDSVETLVKKAKGVDRKVSVALEAALQREKARGPVSDAGAGSGAGAASNAAEDPSVKVLSAKEEKARAKKREQKKKAKAKKRAAAAAAAAAGGAGAGAGAGAAPEDSDDSGDDTGEEGLDEEERMLARAPTFDLEKERAARKARAEAEAGAAGPKEEGK